MTNIFTNNTAQKVHDLVNDLSQCGKNLTHKLSAAEEKARNLEAEVNRLDVQVRRLRDEEAKRLGFGSFDFNPPIQLQVALPKKPSPLPKRKYSATTAVLLRLLRKLEEISDPGSALGIYNNDNRRFFSELIEELEDS